MQVARHHLAGPLDRRRCQKHQQWRMRPRVLSKNPVNGKKKIRHIVIARSRMKLTAGKKKEKNENTNERANEKKPTDGEEAEIQHQHNRRRRPFYGERAPRFGRSCRQWRNRDKLDAHGAHTQLPSSAAAERTKGGPPKEEKPDGGHATSRIRSGARAEHGQTSRPANHKGG